jgi:hypothetical protein
MIKLRSAQTFKTSLSMHAKHRLLYFLLQNACFRVWAYANRNLPHSLKLLASFLFLFQRHFLFLKGILSNVV